MAKILRSEPLKKTLDKIAEGKRQGEQAKMTEQRLSATLDPKLDEILNELEGKIKCNVNLYYDIDQIPRYIKIVPEGHKIGAMSEITLPEGATGIRIEEKSLLGNNLKREVKCLTFGYKDYKFRIYCI